ncbi:MAG: HK97 family phage prohead protease, partial [Muribaculaceae bacterium]|nr:HK97 family phage prohead protease [Muribaculaceae bacterium]
RGSVKDMPIGRIENLRVEGDILYGTPVFDDDTEEERTIGKKWERGTLRMLSAGLDIVEMSEEPELLVAGQTRPTVTRSKLVEVSVVDIGSNDDALQVSLSRDGKLLTLAAGEDSEVLPLLKVEGGEDRVEREETEETKEPNNTKEKKNMNKILLALGLAADATEDQAVEAINKLKGDKETLRLARITDTVESAIKEKRISADKKEKYITLGKTHGIDTLNDILGDMTPVQKPLDLMKPGAAGGAASVDTKLTWDSATAEQLAELKENNREEYVRLYKGYFGFPPEL